MHVLIDYQNVLMVNFARGQKVVPAGWLLSADGPEISLVSGFAEFCILGKKSVHEVCVESICIISKYTQTSTAGQKYNRKISRAMFP